MSTIVRNDAELGRLLGISRAAVSRLKSRGMPTNSLEAAMAWRSANLNPAFCKDTNSARRAATDKRLALASELRALHRVEQLQPVAHAAALAGRFDLVRAELADALASVPSRLRVHVALSVEVWDALCGKAVQAIGETRGDDDCEESGDSADCEGAGAVLYQIAAGEAVVN